MTQGCNQKRIVIKEKKVITGVVLKLIKMIKGAGKEISRILS